MIQNSINQMISLASKTASKVQNNVDLMKSLKDLKGNERASELIKQKQEQANNNFVKNYITPGDIRKELEAKEAEKAKVAAEKGIYEEDYFDEGGNK